MNILGVAFLSDASACVLSGGELVSAVSEERINREKLWFGVPHRAIRMALEIAGFGLDDVDIIATHGLAPDVPERAAFDKKFDRIKKSSLTQSVKDIQTRALEDRYRRECIVLGERTPAYLREIKAYGKPVFVVSHHHAHAACAYYGAGWENCYVLTADGWGEDASSTLWAASNSRLRRLHYSSTFDSLGYFYGSITKALGFKPHRHEGKILGLAAYVSDLPESYAFIKDMVGYDRKAKRIRGGMENGIYKPRYDNPELEQRVHGHSREDVSAAAQRRLEEVICELVDDIGGEELRIALAGGIFANVKLNQRIREMDNVADVYVFPNMGDGGLSVGAAWLAHEDATGERPQPLGTVLQGNDLNEPEIVKALGASGLEYAKTAHIAADIAGLLAAGQVVMRASGRMEFGPRALGNRSILYKCDDPSVNDWLNARLDRSEFMPFAPATLAECADEYYEGLQGGRSPARYMAMTFNCTRKMLDQAPAAVHVDHTARPQLISKDWYPDFYDILCEYRNRTGLVSVINTSFNMHEEPIVCTAEDAIRAFKSSALPWLALGDYLVRGKPEGSCA